MKAGGVSHNRVYWKYWLILVGILLILRFTVFLSSSGRARFYLFIVFAVLTWIPTFIVFTFETRRHLLYLQAWFPQIPPRGPLVYPYILRIRSSTAGDELENPRIRRIIKRYHRFVRFMWLEFLSFAVLYLVVILDRDTLAALIGRIVP
jgi:hypothetical protein